ncbi:hypothetical protein J2Z37_003160 [Ammoniphilus resinae]|uniref:Uncharacterized protein n=1 Tax=Ammoniphilus resinae TaxID=861532 RepID=A0ABS4GSC6_9BACL|nr:hypothetical protein [Ammoniphilus resinae]
MEYPLFSFFSEKSVQLSKKAPNRTLWYTNKFKMIGVVFHFDHLSLNSRCTNRDCSISLLHYMLVNKVRFSLYSLS